MCFNSSLPGQNGHRLADDPFNCIFVIGNLCIFIPILLKFVPKGLVDNNLALVQIMVWGWKCDKPLSEPMLTRFTDAYVWHQGEMNWPRLHSTMFWFKGDVTYWIVVWGFYVADLVMMPDADALARNGCSDIYIHHVPQPRLFSTGL